MTFKEQMKQAGVSPNQLAKATGLKVGTIRQYIWKDKPTEKCVLALKKLSPPVEPTQPASIKDAPLPTVSTEGAAECPTAAPIRGKVLSKWVPNKRMRYIDTGSEVVIAWTRADKYRKAGQVVELVEEGGRLIIKKEIK